MAISGSQYAINALQRFGHHPIFVAIAFLKKSECPD